MIQAIRELRDELRDIGVEIRIWQPHGDCPALTEHDILIINALDHGVDAFDGCAEVLNDIGPVTVASERFTYQDIVPAVISAHIHAVPPVIILTSDEQMENCIAWVIKEVPGKLAHIVWDDLAWKLPKRAA